MIKKHQREFDKCGGLDKYDAYVPAKNQFLHDDFYVSAWKHKFHMSTAHGYYTRGKGGWNMGTQKKLYKASPNGINVDSHYVGKSDE